VVRSYSGQAGSDLMDALTQNEDEVTALISGVPGFVSYVSFRTGDGGAITVTVCDDKAGTDESSRRAAEWVSENLGGGGASPEISEGDSVIAFSA
jgi:hypothetical protein